mgnify:CR=1 FL=1
MSLTENWRLSKRKRMKRNESEIVSNQQKKCLKRNESSKRLNSNKWSESKSEKRKNRPKQRKKCLLNWRQIRKLEVVMWVMMRMKKSSRRKNRDLIRFKKESRLLSHCTQKIDSQELQKLALQRFPKFVKTFSKVPKRRNFEP